MAIPVYERQQSIKPLPTVKVEAADKADAYGSGVGSALTKLSEGSMKLLNDYEDAQTLEAYNNFRRDVSLYHNSPEKGVLNRQGKDTMGLFKDADLWMQNRAEEYAKKMKSPRMIQNFRDMAGRTIISQGEHNSQYEGQQFRKYQVAEAQASIKLSIDDAIANWQDDGVAQSSREMALKFLGTISRGQGDEFWRAGVAEIDNEIAMGRLGRMIEADPIAAEQWYKEHKQSFLGADQAKAEGLLEKETRAYKTQSAVDNLVRLFPPEREREALKYIREKFSGEDEEHIATAYKTRINELEVKKGNAEAGVRKIQNSNFEVLKKQFYRNGAIPSQEELDRLLDDNLIRVDQYARAMSWNDMFATRTKTVTYLQKNDTNWNNYTPEQKEIRLMRFMGKNNEQHKAILNTIRSGVLDGSVTDADIEDYYDNGDITTNERNYYKNLDKKIGTEQKAFIKKHKEALGLDIAKTRMKTSSVQESVYKKWAEQSFEDKVDELMLDPTSKTFRQDVIDARRKAFVEAVAATGRSQTRDPWFGDPYLNSFGLRVQAAEAAIEEEIKNVEEYVPENYESPVELSSDGRTAAKETPPPPRQQAKPPYRAQPEQARTSPFILGSQPQTMRPLPGPRITEDGLNKILFSE
jgi:hypothetical protein